ncbi:MAG: TonB-dependent receptor [Nitrosomonas sp.]
MRHERLSKLISGLILGGVFFSQPVYSQPIAADKNDQEQPVKQTQKTKKGSDSTFRLGEVEVKTTKTGKLSTKDVFTSVDVVGKSLIQNQNVNYVWELFNRIPGALLTNFNQGNTNGKFSFRGFNGEGEINAVKLLIDGIPSNTNDGNMPFLDALFPLNIESIETVRGTNDPRYGLHNIAGNANITTTMGGTYAKGRVNHGSFNTTDVQAGAGYEKNGFMQNYFIGYRTTDGHRAHSDMNKFSVSGKWFYAPDDANFQVGASVRHYTNHAQEPGYLTLEESRTRPFSTNAFNSTDGGRRTMNQYSAHIDIDLRHDLSWSTKAYYNDYDDSRFVKFSANVSQQNRVTQEQQYGLLSTFTYRPVVPFLRDFAVETGVDIQFQENKSKRFLTDQRVRTSQTRDQRFDFNIFGAYIQTMLKPFDSLKIVPAYRVDTIDGHLTNNLNGQRYSINDYDFIHQPKISVVYTPIEGYSFYGNWGRTFQVGVGADSYLIPPRIANLGPSLNHGWEAGIKLNPVSWFEGRIATWEQTASNEARRILNSANNDAENIGRTRRRGVDFQVNITPIDPLTMWLTYTWQDSKIMQAGSGLGSTQDKEIDHIPNHMGSGGIDYKITPDLLFNLWANYQNNYFVERTNTAGRFGGFIVGNLGLSYQATKRINVEFQIRNINDARYEYVWWDGAQSLHSPAAGRSFYGGVVLSF